MSRHLGKFEKMWNSPCIAIEDPFDLSHNLGAGISRKMNMFIKTAFIRTRELFGIPSPKIPKFHSKIPIEQLKVCLYLSKGKSFSEKHILASTNQLHEKTVHGITIKTTSAERYQNMFFPCSAPVVFMVIP